MIKYASLTALALFAAPSQAQTFDSGNQPLAVFGTANPACLMRSGATATGNNASFQGGGNNSGQVTIGQMVDPFTAQTKASGITISLPIICNSAHLVTVHSVNGGLSLNAANNRNVQGNGFATFVPYVINAQWAGQSVSGQSNANTSLNITSNNGGVGNALIGFNVSAGGTPLVAGSYSDSIVVEFKAAN